MVLGFSEIQEHNTDYRGRIMPAMYERPVGKRDLGSQVPYARCADGCYVPVDKYLARTRAPISILVGTIVYAAPDVAIAAAKPEEHPEPYRLHLPEPVPVEGTLSEKIRKLLGGASPLHH